MNFYKHHLGDYYKDTVHLSWMEDCAYRRLLDHQVAEPRCAALGLVVRAFDGRPEGCHRIGHEVGDAVDAVGRV